MSTQIRGNTQILADSITNTEINSAAAIGWAKISKTSSSLADLATRSASDLSSGTLADARLSTNVPLLDAASNAFTGTMRVGPSAGAGSLAPVEFVSASDVGVAITSTSTAAAGAVESYLAGFMKDSSGTLQKVGAAAFQWTNKDATSGYASWNIHTTGISGGVSTDYYGLTVWANHGAAFFPSDLTSSSAPGARVLKINGSLTTGGVTSSDTIAYANSSNSLMTALSMRNSSTGTAAQTRFQIGNDASPFAFTIDINGSNYTGAANVALFINQFNADLRMGGWGTIAIAMGSGGAVQFPTYTAASFAAGDKYLVIDASGNVHVSALGPAS